MDGIKAFLSQIDGRIFEINFSNLGNTDNSNYLFDPKPQSFYFQSWAFVIGVLGIVAMILLMQFLKRRRNTLNIEKPKRDILNFHVKLNLVFFSLFFVLVFARSQGMSFLSMRFFEWLSIGLVFVSTIAALIRVALYKPEEETETEISSDDTYQKYLPKKKKKNN
jgi:magnesium-transporting ATPase (P-type)